jgi:hypothetical protein
VTKLLELIDALTSPANMTLIQAKAYLERLTTEIDCRIGGIKDDIAMNEARGADDNDGEEPWRNTP